MANQFEHLELPVSGEVLPRRLRSSRTTQRDNVRAHGRELIQEADEIIGKFNKRIQESPPTINPKLIFKLELDGNLPDVELGRLGLTVLAQAPGKAIVVFPDEPTLSELRSRLNQYSGIVRGNKYSNLANIASISELEPEDRIGPKLRATPLKEDEVTPLDIELWHLGTRDACFERINEIRDYLANSNNPDVRVTDNYIGTSLCLIRARVDYNSLAELLQVDYVKEIDRRPKPAFEMLNVIRLGLEQVEYDPVIPDDTTGILIIDSGVTQQHPLIGFALGDAQAFPQAFADEDGPEDVDEEFGGHGTAVAGIAIYNDIGECLDTGVFQATARLFSARVTDSNNEYDPDQLLERQFREALTYFIENYPTLKVVNISLGDSDYIYDDGYQFRFAAAIDELAFFYRDRQLVFVLSAGNFWPNLDHDDIVRLYPDYLTSQEARVIDPATSAIGITVGGLSYGAGRNRDLVDENDTDRLVAGTRAWPSPFTRTGSGVDGAIKPEVVDFAGDLLFRKGRVHEYPAQHAGLPTTSKRFSPPDGRLFRTVAGTSFAAPRVANLAARLFNEFPQATSNLIRALIADSARVPDDRPSPLDKMKSWEKNILQIYGYGQPNFERARWSQDNNALLLAEDSVEIDRFKRYTIPPLPPEFFTERGTGYISVTLAYDPPTRHTRYNNYLGVGMKYYLFRNINATQIDEAFRKWTQEEKKELGKDEEILSLTKIGKYSINFMPGVNQRSNGTLQKGLATVSNNSWKYDGQSLHLVVVCLSTPWTPPEIINQRYAVVASIYHDSPNISLYSHLRQFTRVYQQARIRL